MSRYFIYIPVLSAATNFRYWLPIVTIHTIIIIEHTYHKMSLYGLFSLATSYLPIGGGGAQTTKAALGKTRSLYVPDLFAGILSGEPTRNPYEEEIGRKSEEWTKK